MHLVHAKLALPTQNRIKNLPCRMVDGEGCTDRRRRGLCIAEHIMQCIASSASTGLPKQIRFNNRRGLQIRLQAIITLEANTSRVIWIMILSHSQPNANSFESQRDALQQLAARTTIAPTCNFKISRCEFRITETEHRLCALYRGFN